MSPKKKNCNVSCRKGGRVFSEFCESTSIHGLKYIVENESHWLERVIWVLVFLAGVCFSGYFCFQMWQKWDESPVLMSLDSNRFPLKELPFPAITICNVNKVSKRSLLKVLEEPRYKNISYDAMQNTLRYMTKLDRAINNENKLSELDALYNSYNITPADLFNILNRTSPSCNDMVLDCIWLGLPSPCIEYFSFLPTDDGICCTFNGPQNYSDQELGIFTTNRMPLKVAGNGYRMGLALVIDADVNDYSVTNGKFDGFKVLVHSSEEFPDVSDRGFVIGPGSEAFVGVKGVTTFNTEEVAKEVSAEKRNCVVKGEKQLSYFQNYSRSACDVECATKKMENDCGCRPYFFRADKRTPLCTLQNYTCISNVTDTIRRGDLCDCPPPCSDIFFEPEISYASFPGHGFNLTRTYKRLISAVNLTAGADGNQYLKANMAVLHIYYKDKTGVRYKTDVRFGIEDFISAMGGLLGLGLGLSFISVIELLYFLFIRLFFISRGKKKDGEMEPNNPLPLSYRPDNIKSWPSSSTVMTQAASVGSLNNFDRS